MLANERTFAGWMRPAMAALAIAIGLHAIFGKVDAGYSPARLVSSVFVVFAMVAIWISRNRAIAALKRLECHTVKPVETRRLTLLCVLMTIGPLGTGALLWAI